MKKDPTILRHVFHPATGEFDALVRGCELGDLRHKFGQLKGLSPSALRSLVGSADRLLGAVVNDPAFAARCRGGFALGDFLQRGGKLIVEGADAGDDAKRTILGAIVLLAIEHAKRRPRPFPIIRVRIDEANTARLVGAPELKGIATTRKYGLFFDFLAQGLDFPGGPEAVLQNCKRHEFFGMANYDLARKAATDLAAGLPADERSRAERIAALADDLMNLKPGWRWVRDAAGSRREYVPLLENPWVDWPGLRTAKLREKLQWIHARREFGGRNTPPSTPSSPSSPPPPPSSPSGSSPAERWRRERRRPTDGSSDNGGGGESQS
jgi:hypothetical protein